MSSKIITGGISSLNKALNRLPEDKGVGSIYPFEQAELATIADAPPALKEVGRAGKSRFLTKPEILKTGRRPSAERIDNLLEMMPTAKEMATVAQAGNVKRGWYRTSAEAIVGIFEDDSPRFAALLAALSPQTSVESNLLNTMNVFKNWSLGQRLADPSLVGMMDKPGASLLLTNRKTQNNRAVRISPEEALKRWEDLGGTKESYDIGREQIRIMGDSVEGEKGEDSVLGAWVGNSIRALNQPEDQFDKMVISGPKVDSFYRNLLGNTIEVTNDTWMARYMGVPQDIFAGTGFNRARMDPGKGPGYLAANALTRNAAEILSRRIGEPVSGPEIQEMVWTWAKRVVEVARNQGVTPVELIRRNGLPDAMIQETPDFGNLLRDPEGPYREIIESAGYSPGEFTPAPPITTNVTEEIMGSGDAPRRDLQRAAGRLHKITRALEGDKLALAAFIPMVGAQAYMMSKDSPESQ